MKRMMVCTLCPTSECSLCLFHCCGQVTAMSLTGYISSLEQTHIHTYEQLRVAIEPNSMSSDSGRWSQTVRFLGRTQANYTTQEGPGHKLSK